MADLKQFEDLVEQYWKRILRSLGLDPDSMPTPAVVRTNEAVPEGGAAWNIDDARIKISSRYLQNADPSDYAGMIVHELTHGAIYNAAGVDLAANKRADKWMEPISDAMRYKLTGNAGGWQASDEAMRMADLSTRELKYLTASMQAGQFSPRLLKAVEAGEMDQQIRQYTQSVSGSDGYSTADDATDVGSGGVGQDPFEVGGGGGIGQGGPGGGGEGGGDGTSSAAGPEDRKTQANNSASFISYISSLGINITDQVSGLIEQAARWGWNLDRVMNEVRTTQAYRQRFPGIFDKGELKMTEAEYIQSEKLYDSYAAQAGINMGKKRMSYLFRNDVSPDEFADKAVAYSRINKNKELYGAFRRELVQAGIAKPSEVNSNKELYKFVMGSGNKQWADLWQDTVTRNAAQMAGIAVARNKEKYASIGQKALERISSMDLSEEEMAAKFVQLSDTLTGVMPLQESDLYGLKKSAVTKAVFGGKNSARARQKLELVVNTDEAFYEQRATNQVYSDEQGGLVTQGVTDRSRQQQSEY